MVFSRSYMVSHFGCDRPGKLESIIMHTPGRELELINEDNYHYWRFNRVPDIPKFIDEHLRYRDLLRSQGIIVYELEELVPAFRNKIYKQPNITYLNNTAVISCKGAIISQMALDARRVEQEIVKNAISTVGIPILFEFSSQDDPFEGCTLLSEDTLLVAQTERHGYASVQKFISNMLSNFKEIILIDLPKNPKFRHPESAFKKIRSNLALAYLPAVSKSSLVTKDEILPIDFESHMKSLGIEIVNVSSFEQQRHACSFLPLNEGVILHYDTALDASTRRQLVSKGVEFVFFHSEALQAGGGSLNCLSLPLAKS